MPKRKQQFTVIGFYQDNDQPFLFFKKAIDAETAAQEIITLIKNKNEGSDPAVVEVIKGKHISVFNSRYIMKCFDVLGR